MSAPKDFWLCLREFATCYEAAGLTTDERIANIVEQFRGLPHIAQRELLDDLYRIVMDSPDIYTLARTAANERQKPQTAPAGKLQAG